MPKQIYISRGWGKVSRFISRGTQSPESYGRRLRKQRRMNQPTNQPTNLRANSTETLIGFSVLQFDCHWQQQSNERLTRTVRSDVNRPLIILIAHANASIITAGTVPWGPQRWGYQEETLPKATAAQNGDGNGKQPNSERITIYILICYCKIRW